MGLEATGPERKSSKQTRDDLVGIARFNET